MGSVSDGGLLYDVVSSAQLLKHLGQQMNMQIDYFVSDINFNSKTLFNYSMKFTNFENTDSGNQDINTYSGNAVEMP
jgi:hypothetical protein